MCPKNSAATRSAAEQHEVGCPLPAAVVAAIEWIRSWLAMPFKVPISMSFMSDAECMRPRRKRKRNRRDHSKIDRSLLDRQRCLAEGFAEGRMGMTGAR